MPRIVCVNHPGKGVANLYLVESIHNMRTSMYKTAYCGPNGVLIVEL